MKILVIGSGGREHALAFKLAESPNVHTVFVAPGNAGTALENKVINVNISAENINKLANFAIDNSIDLTVVGPEQPLVLGVVDTFQSRGLTIFGPTAAAAQLEGSKSFTKDFLAKYKIPTADYQTFEDIDLAISYIKTKGAPIVVKADGLAAGKGVIVALTESEAIDAVQDMLADNKFGDAGSRVVIEEYLDGEEASFIVMVDGKNVLPFATSQDHKRAFDKDEGPNTGGMGAYSPAPVVTEQVNQRIMNEVIYPTVLGMQAEGTPYVGFLYAGLMIDSLGTPKVIEFNCRFGDPETQPIMLRLDSDLAQLCLSACKGKLASEVINFKKEMSVGVVIASGGYPGNYEKHKVISGLDSIPDDIKVFHAGTYLDEGSIKTNGGRVLCITGLGNSITEACEKVYNAISSIEWEESFYRSDIGYRAIKREKTEN